MANLEEDMADKHEEYLGDAVYASYDGYQVWLRTGDGNDNRIALDPYVLAALIHYVENLSPGFIANQLPRREKEMDDAI